MKTWTIENMNFIEYEGKVYVLTEDVLKELKKYKKISQSITLAKEKK